MQHLGRPEEGQNEAGPLRGQGRDSVSRLRPVQGALVPVDWLVVRIGSAAGADVELYARGAGLG